MHDRAAKATADRLAGVTNIDLTFIGKMIEREGDLAVVSVSDARLLVPVVGDVFPAAGEFVRLMRVGQQTLLLGLARTRSALGKVTAITGGGLVEVEYPSGSGVTAEMRYPKYYTPAVNDEVLIDWTSGGTVIAALEPTPAVTVPVETTPPPARTSHTQIFTAIDSGTENVGGSNWWTNEVYAGDTTLGGWFYGTKIKDTIPDNATITSARAYLPIRQYFGAAPNFAIHGYASKPAGTITYIGQVALTGARSGWITLPAGWGAYLAINSGGLGMNHGGYNIYYGTQRDGMSGAVEISWTTA